MKRICNMYSVKKRNTKFLSKLQLILALCFICVITISASFMTSNKANASHYQIKESVQVEQIDSVSLYTDSLCILKAGLVEEVQNYMTSVYPNTKMSAKHITNLCLEHNFDIPLLLSQAHLESQFGKRTGGTNSCFGVAYRSYSHVNESVNDYIRIMKKSYVKKRSAEACIQSGFRVEGSKTLKYAEDPIYSKTISKIRTNIIKNTKIVQYFNQINELQIILNNTI